VGETAHEDSQERIDDTDATRAEQTVSVVGAEAAVETVTGHHADGF